ncbi:MAG: TIGR00295 family protein [Candidatus Thermoplasmatota archaeon]|nr:TIGR00295 family protein [Candidatus Thermoplasmatota archaeon]
MPSKEECLKILRSAGCSKAVIDHCKAVANLARKIAIYANADIELVECSALLHDIGRARTHGVKHGVEGAKLARKLGFNENICLILERHLGAGICREEAKALGLPKKDYIPQTLEEKIVAHSDNLIAGCKKQKLKDVVKSYLKIGRKDIAKRIFKLHKELSEICGIDLDEL